MMSVRTAPTMYSDVRIDRLIGQLLSGCYMLLLSLSVWFEEFVVEFVGHIYTYISGLLNTLLLHLLWLVSQCKMF